MEIRTAEEVTGLIESYAVDILDEQIKKKAIDKVIKDIKQDAKEDGIAIGRVMKVINNIKRRAKQSEADNLEEAILEEALENSTLIQDKVAQANAD